MSGKLLNFYPLCLVAFLLVTREGGLKAADTLPSTADETPTVTSSPEPRDVTSRKIPKAEPVDHVDYPRYDFKSDQSPSKMDFGPAQRLFTFATHLDTRQEDDDEAMEATPSVAKNELDKSVRFDLIHEVHNQITNPNVFNNQGLQADLDYLNWGAVTGRQKEMRLGDYLTITWTNRGPPADFMIKLEYRQVRSNDIIRTLVSEAKHARGGIRSYFAVIGDAYRVYGPMSAWRLSLTRGDQIVAQTQSYIW